MDIDKELFLWSVIADRRDLALLFWSRAKNKISAALIATLLYKKHARNEKDSSYKKSADEFENLAVQILDKFYQADSQTCTKAIIRRIPAWGNVTWLDLAIAADAKQFIARRAVQDLLNNIWFGYIDQRTSHKKIIFSTLMIWYSGFLLYNKELVQSIDKAVFLDEQTKKLNSTENQTSDNKWIVYKKRPGLYQYLINITRFMHTPYIKYLYNLYFHMIFLLLFSYLILCDFLPLYGFPIDICTSAKDSKDRKDNVADKNDNQPSINTSLIGNRYNASTSGSYESQRRKRPSGIEFVLVIWIFTLVCEEIRQLFATEAQSKRNAIIAYFKVFWNKLDVLAVVLFFIGFTLRFIPTVECFCAARVVLSIDLTVWFMRTLDLFAAVKRLGPKLVMIGEMVNDLRFFMIMLIVFILAFGVSSYSLIHGIQKLSWHLLRDIINHAYWRIFGDLNTLETFSTNYKANGYAAFILLVGYMAVVSILLVNLLIAMFSNTFTNLQVDTDRIWKFQQYTLVCEYLSRPSLPPPLIIFSHVWRLTLCIAAKYFKLNFFQEQYRRHLNRTDYKISLDEKKAIAIELAEDTFGDDVYYDFLKIAYNRYELDFRFMSKSDLYLMAHIIDPKNVISLTLSDERQTPDQIQLFLSHFRIDQFIRLRSLTLFNIENEDLNEFQKHIMQYPLTTFSISTPDFCEGNSGALLSSIISHKSLRKLEFKGDGWILNDIQWPISCRLEHVIICCQCNWNTVYSILGHLPQLRTLILKDVCGNRFDETIIIQSSQLTSLLLNNSSDITMDNIESLLSFLPKLTHFRLIGQTSITDPLLFDGSRWENFIEMKLPLLNKFEFWLTSDAFDEVDRTTVESLIAPFRTSFWLDTKHWLVKCDGEYDEYDRRFYLYSIPIFQDNFHYSDQRSTIVDFKLNTGVNNITIIHNAHELSLDLSHMMTPSIGHK
ncbi:unnamed protein product, partial [Rotaria sordida]